MLTDQPRSPCHPFLQDKIRAAVKTGVEETREMKIDRPVAQGPRAYSCENERRV